MRQRITRLPVGRAVEKGLVEYFRERGPLVGVSVREGRGSLIGDKKPPIITVTSTDGEELDDMPAGSGPRMVSVEVELKVKAKDGEEKADQWRAEVGCALRSLSGAQDYFQGAKAAVSGIHLHDLVFTPGEERAERSEWFTVWNIEATVEEVAF